MAWYRRYSTNVEFEVMRIMSMTSYFTDISNLYKTTSYGAKISGFSQYRDNYSGFIFSDWDSAEKYTFDKALKGGISYVYRVKYDLNLVQIEYTGVKLRTDPYNIQKNDDLGIVDLAEFVPSKYNPKINNLDGYWYEPVYFPRVVVKGRGKARLKINGKTVVDIKYKDANGVIKSDKKE